jgi:HEAT repeat protein
MKSESPSRLTPADEAALCEIRAWAADGAAAVPRLLEALRTRSWAVRRHVVDQLASLGLEAASAMTQSLRGDRVGESRLAALVDALVATPADIDALVLELLNDANAAVICDALQIVGRRRMVAALERTIFLSGHEDDNVAVASIEALGQMGGEQALSRLLELARSGSFFRSFPAIDVLGRLGDSRAVETLLAVLDDPMRGAEAVRALGRLGDETALRELLKWLATSQAAGTRLGAVAISAIHERLLLRFGTSTLLERALSSHPLREATEVRLHRSLTGADPIEKQAICNLLGLFPSGASVEALFVLLREPGDVARAAAHSLGRLARLGNTDVVELAQSLAGEECLSLLPELAGVTAAVPWLLERLHDAEHRVRLLACDALAKTGDRQAVPALFELLAEGDLSLSQAATAALQSLGAAQTEELALAAAQSHGPERHAGLRILAYFGTKSALSVLLGAVRDADERAREIALSGLAIIDGDAAIAALLEASRHPSPRTRAAAARALGTVETTPAISERLGEATSDDDAWVRYQACQALGNAGDIAAAPLLAARLLDEAGQVRVAAVDAIARLPGPPAREVLERAAQHEDVEVRRAALTGMGFARQPSSLPVLLQAAGAADTATRLVAISSLARYDSPEALKRILAVARADEDTSVQNAAIELLAEQTTPEAGSALVELLSNDAQRERAAQALHRHATLHASQLAAALHGAPAAVADVIVGALTRLPRAQAEAELLRALQLSNVHARRAAARALRVAFDADAAVVREALATCAVRDPDPEARRIAAARLS